MLTKFLLSNPDLDKYKSLIVGLRVKKKWVNGC